MGSTQARLIAAYSVGILSLDELAAQKAMQDKEISSLAQTLSALREEAEPQLLSTEHIETIEAIAAEVRAGADVTDGNRQA